MLRNDVPSVTINDVVIPGEAKGLLRVCIAGRELEYCPMQHVKEFYQSKDGRSDYLVVATWFAVDRGWV